MKQLLYASIVLTSSLLLSCQKEAAQNKNTSNTPPPAVAAKAAAENDRPLKGKYTTASHILQPAPFLKTRITGSGTMTHLGQGSFVAESTIDFTTQPPFSLGGTAVFTASNGDAFYTTFTGTSTPEGANSFAIINIHTITGGTGRFQHATGNLTGYTVAFPGHTEGYIEYEGNIRY